MTQQKTEDADADRRRLVDEARAAREQARALSEEAAMAVSTSCAGQYWRALARESRQGSTARTGPWEWRRFGAGSAGIYRPPTFAAARLSTAAATERVTWRWTENVDAPVRRGEEVAINDLKCADSKSSTSPMRAIEAPTRHSSMQRTSVPGYRGPPSHSIAHAAPNGVLLESVSRIVGREHSKSLHCATNR